MSTGVVVESQIQRGGSSGAWSRSVLSVRGAPDRPIVEPMPDDESRSLDYADADGWRCFYPLTRGNLSAAEARAIMRRERGLPEETAEEGKAADFLLSTERRRWSE